MDRIGISIFASREPAERPRVCCRLFTCDGLTVGESSSIADIDRDTNGGSSGSGSGFGRGEVDLDRRGIDSTPNSLEALGVVMVLNGETGL